MALLSAVLAGSIIFPTLYFSVRSWLARTWPNLTAADRAVISRGSQTAVITMHSFLSCSSGAAIVFSCMGDVMNDGHWLAEWYAGFTTALYVFDIWAMYESESCKAAASGHDRRLPWTTFLAKRWSMVAHHVIFAAVYFITTILRRGVGDFFIGCFFLLEIPAPFANFKPVFIQLKMTGTGLYVANEIAIFVTFCLCRSAIFPFMLWAYGQQYGLQMMDVPYRIPRKCIAGCAVVMAFQFYWGVPIILNGFRAIAAKVYNKEKE